MGYNSAKQLSSTYFPNIQKCKSSRVNEAGVIFIVAHVILYIDNMHLKRHIRIWRPLHQCIEWHTLCEVVFPHIKKLHL